MASSVYREDEGLQVHQSPYTPPPALNNSNTPQPVYYQPQPQPPPSFYEKTPVTSGGSIIYQPGPHPQLSQIPPPPRRTILGVKRSIFIIIVLLVLACIGASIGIGFAIAHKTSSTSTSNKAVSGDSSSNTSAPVAATTAGDSQATTTPMATKTVTVTASSTTSSPSPFPTTGQLAIDCPAIDGTEYTTAVSSTENATFTIHCNINYPATDLKQLQTYTIDECMDACATYAGCVGMVFNANLTSAIAITGNDCFLKPNIGGGYIGTHSNIGAGAVLNTT